LACSRTYAPMSIHSADLLSLSPLGEGIPCHSDQLGQCAPARNGFGGVLTMPEGVLIADRGAASGCPTMHSTPALSEYRRRLARLPTPGPGSASGRLVHRQMVAVLGLFLRFSLPLPPEVTAPTIACPPAWTWTCSTVTFCCPLPRYRWSASTCIVKVGNPLNPETNRCHNTIFSKSRLRCTYLREKSGLGHAKPFPVEFLLAPRRSRRQLAPQVNAREAGRMSDGLKISSARRRRALRPRSMIQRGLPSFPYGRSVRHAIAQTRRHQYSHSCVEPSLWLRRRFHKPRPVFETR
jgi:hypothetical protein